MTPPDPDPMVASMELERRMIKAERDIIEAALLWAAADRLGHQGPAVRARGTLYDACDRLTQCRAVIEWARKQRTEAEP